MSSAVVGSRQNNNWICTHYLIYSSKPTSERLNQSKDFSISRSKTESSSGSLWFGNARLSSAKLGKVTAIKCSFKYFINIILRESGVSKE